MVGSSRSLRVFRSGMGNLLPVFVCNMAAGDGVPSFDATHPRPLHLIEHFP